MKNLKVTVNGTVYDVQVEETGSSQPAPQAAAPAAPKAPAAASAPAAPKPAAKASAPAGGEVISCPMPGTIVSVNVTEGQAVKKGAVLAVLEAMKMENEIMAPHDATVAKNLVGEWVRSLRCTLCVTSFRMTKPSSCSRLPVPWSLFAVAMPFPTLRFHSHRKNFYSILRIAGESTRLFLIPCWYGKIESCLKLCLKVTYWLFLLNPYTTPQIIAFRQFPN